MENMKHIAVAGAIIALSGVDPSGLFDEPKGKGLGKRSRVSARQIKPGPKAGRNDPCPCGSGKKFKKCCINK